MEDLPNEETCPYCNQLIEKELFSDHLMCHQLQNEEEFNSHNNINPYRNNNSNSSQNRNQNSNSHNSNHNSNTNSNNNQDNNIFSNVFDLFGPLNNNNNGSNPNNLGFFNSLIGRNPHLNNNEHQINNNRNNSNNNNRNNNNSGNAEEGNIFNLLSDGLTNVSNAINNFKELGSQINNIGANLFGNDSPRNNSSNNNPIRPANNILPRNINPVPVRIGAPLNIRNIYRNRPPPIIVHGNRYRSDRNNNHINGNDINRIMELLPSTVLNEKKEGENNNCIICLGEFDIGESVTTLPCVHLFHTDCIKNWLKSQNHCPICKFEITLNSIRRES